MVIKQKVKLDLRFNTINGGLTPKHLTCWVAPSGRPAEMNDILLREGATVVCLTDSNILYARDATSE